MRKIKRTQSRALALFGLPFFAVGLFFIYLIAGSLYDGFRMASWPQTQGTLSSAHIRSSTSDNSTSYEAEAQYRYRVGGREYFGDRVAIQGGGDNIGDFQQQLGWELESLYRNRQSVTVYYNPDNPAEAVLNREMRWGLIGFKAIFVLTFGGVGLGLIIFGLRGKRVIDTPEAAEKPWLARTEWADNRIRSGARTMVYIAWFFAIFWNLISSPGVFFFQEVWRDEGPVALFILLFPLVGLGLLYWALRQTLEWRRFGYTPLRLDPFPGAIGGDVGGEIELNFPYQPGLACEVTLSSLYSYVSGSGKNRSRHERVEWQDSGYAQVEPAGRGMQLRFRFAVPEGLRPSEAEQGNYYLWRLSIKAELPGVDLSRSFTIPVYATAEKSHLHRLDTAREVPRGVPELTAESLLPLRRNGMLQELYYPMLRRPGLALGLILFGSIFVAVGLFLWGEAANEGGMLYLMAGIFSFVGGAVVLSGLYTALNSLYVGWNGSQIRVIRRLLGVVIRRHQVSYHEVQGVELKKGGTSTQKGNQHQINYQVLAKIPAGEMLLAEQLDSHSKAKLVVEFFRKQFRLRE